MSQNGYGAESAKNTGSHRRIADSQTIKPGNRMPNYKQFSPDDLNALADYMESLK